MFKSLKALAKARESTGALSGRQITVGSRTVKVERLLGEVRTNKQFTGRRQTRGGSRAPPRLLPPPWC